MLPNYFIAENNEFSKGAVFVIGTRTPYPMGQVYRFNTRDQLATFENTSGKKFARIPGYYAVVAHFSNMDPGTSPKTCSITVLQQMAAFFLRNRINNDQGYWQRYAEKQAP